MRKEIVNISKSFDQKKISVLHLKGVTLADEIYAEKPEIRKANDIDILVSYDQIEESLNLMGELGYYLQATNEPVSMETVMRFSSQVLQDRIHFPEFEKQFNLSDSIMKIQLDFHVSTVHALESQVSIMNTIIERSVTQKLFGYDIKVFEIHDRILHLIAHLTKEYFRNIIRWYLAADRDISDEYFPLNLLHDIALLVHKHDINYGILCSYAEQLNMSDELLLIYKILNIIYLDLVPVAEIKKLETKDLNTGSYYYKRYSMFYPLSLSLKLDPELIISKSIFELSSLIMRHGLQLEKTIEITGDMQQFYISKRRENDIVQGSKITNINKNCLSKLNLSYNNHLNFRT